MKTERNKTCIMAAILAGVCILSGGCRPTAYEVASVMSSVPLGATRDDVRKVLLAAYSKKYPRWKQAYGLTEPLLPLTKQIIDAEKQVMTGFKSRGHYCHAFPVDLLDKLRPTGFTDGIGLVAEGARGNGAVSIYYDSNTNYIGFFAFSTMKARK